MVENIEDQCSEETFYYNWSGLDLENPHGNESLSVTGESTSVT